MSAASCLLTEDQFLCSICLDVFTDPVSTPCGHNFCKNCITEYWNINVQCQCPNCKKGFNTRPELQVNTFISEVAAQFRQSAQQKASSSSSEQQAAKPGEVPCDVCTGTKLKALKSCLVCLASYCETHLEPHLTSSSLKRHQLIEPVEDLEGRMCTKHDQLLELFCKTDQMCVCTLCTALGHKTHDVVPLKEEYEGKKAELGKIEAEIQEMIQMRQLKIWEIIQSVELSKEDADREIVDGVTFFTALKESVERSQIKLIETIKEKQRTKERQAEDFIKALEQEISELMMRSSELDQLSCSEDHLHLLQRFPYLKAAPPTMDWTDISVHPTSYEGTVVRAVAELEQTITKQMKRLFEVELKRVQQYTVHVTLDPDVVHPRPAQSNDRQQVKRGNDCRCVLSKRGFTSGRFYFQVQVNRWSTWTLGVARKLTNMSREITLCPRNGYWTVCSKSSGEYFAPADPSVRLSLKPKPEKVGVFVDFDEGLVSFYDIDVAALIYSFTGCSFIEEIYPFFSPCPHDGVTMHLPDNMCVLQ
ncbi:E3 ubiquitin-protein ligase TRIM21-like [Thunnus albacares]|uniref:E3 ubiquitin-protein ligase TRIM21-like n=1 Tax=Thunnus albacares TaxID=8236 RepID=UPI001CF6C334|nr:E3 ubiquitin-protein ligase TRIM21-like [Thunnus albacares]